MADERFYPKEMELDYYVYKRHFERYFTSLDLCKQIGKNQTWLDCACGSGYGTNFLGNFVDFIYGYDISEDAIEYALKNYKNENTFFISSLNSIDKESIDKVFSIETIEHMPLEDTNIFLDSLFKILKKDGELIITTPIVQVTNTNPKNKFHFLEYSDEDFNLLLEKSNFKVLNKLFVPTTFTDGETKDQGYYLCKKQT